MIFYRNGDALGFYDRITGETYINADKTQITTRNLRSLTVSVGEFSAFCFKHILKARDFLPTEWLNWISQGKSLSLDEKKIQDLVDKQRRTLADVEYLDLNSVANIVNNFENPTIDNRNSGNALGVNEI